MTKKQFYRELARRSKKRVPNMRSMTFADLADLNESYISRCLDEREAECELPRVVDHRNNPLSQVLKEALEQSKPKPV